MSWKPFLAVIGLLLVGIGVWYDQSTPVPPGAPAVISTTSALFKEATSADLRRLVSQKKLTLINLWASWCDPCKAEFPGIVKLREKYQPQGFQVLFVSMDAKSDWDAALHFLESQHVDFETYVVSGSPAQLGADLDPRWEGAVPTSFLFAQDGKRIDSWQGENSYEQFEAKIKPHLTP